MELPRPFYKKDLRDMIAGACILIAALACLALAIFEINLRERDTSLVLFSLVLFAGLGLVGAYMIAGIKLQKVKVGPDREMVFGHSAEEIVIEQKQLDDSIRKEREQKADTVVLPGREADRFNTFYGIKANDVPLRPSAYANVPMYMLDKNYHVLDWNLAFALAFDRTMEGRRGHSVLEWTYFLDNYDEVLDHGSRTYGDPENLPNVDKEKILYTSLRYGQITATKLAYQIPDEDGTCLAWLLVLEPSFETAAIENKYKGDLIRVLGQDALWSEYALYYDELLTRTTIYKNLLDVMIGDKGSLGAIPAEARILDLGAGTGNLTYELMVRQPKRTVVALENNETMLSVLRSKCARWLVRNPDSAGVIEIKQDAQSLYGLDDSLFDVVIANNVIYAVHDVPGCLGEAYRVLKPNGELRISGPHKQSSPERLFSLIEADLRNDNQFDGLETVFQHVYDINRFRLRSLLNRFSEQDMSALLKEAGFSKVEIATDKIYGGESMLVRAFK